MAVSTAIFFVVSFFFSFLCTLGGTAVQASSAHRGEHGILLRLGRKVTAGAAVGEDYAAVRKSYAVIFDAGSTGSRVHVFCFNQNLDLVPVGDDGALELFAKTTPGLSSYATDPEAGANSLLPLLEKAEGVVPVELRQNTPVKLGATAGLRTLGANTSESILQAVRELLQEKSSLEYKSEWVTILDGSQEGAYLWVAMNYLLGNVGKKYANTTGVVDLGGGSVQMAYAISENAAANAPTNKDGEAYVKKLSLKGSKYDLYVHSYLLYGLLAARAVILQVEGGLGHVCILDGYNGTYSYGDASYDASASPSGCSYRKCRRAVLEALKVDEPCTYKKCTFGGVWNGGRGAGQKNLYLASFFYDKAAQVGFIDSKVPSAKVKPADFAQAAKHVCELSLADVEARYPHVLDVPFLCMDLVYQYTLLVDGFGLHPRQEVTLVEQVKYGGNLVGAAWPLGSAIEVTSSAKGNSAHLHMHLQK